MLLRVLFLCATNGVQSPMAEALLKRTHPISFEGVSAGIELAEMHPLTVEVMKEIDINLEGRRPISVCDVLNQHFDFVITMGEQSPTVVPMFPKAERIHWRFEEPTKCVPEKQKHMFQIVRDQIAQRIHLFAVVQARAQLARAG